jgi:tRNA-specific adenosine deaminase 3
LDPPNECIKYTTTRPIEAGEELCIFYGHSLWFELAEGPQASSSQGINRNLFPPLREEADPFQQGDPDEILLPEELPFKLHRLPPEEETVETVQTGMCTN